MKKIKTKYLLKNIYTNELEEVKEETFNELVIKYRNAFKREYETPNIQNFILEGDIYAKKIKSIG